MKLEKENMLKQTQKLMNKFMNLEKINRLIQVDTNSGQTHAVVTQSEALVKDWTASAPRSETFSSPT